MTAYTIIKESGERVQVNLNELVYEYRTLPVTVGGVHVDDMGMWVPTRKVRPIEPMNPPRLIGGPVHNELLVSRNGVRVQNNALLRKLLFEAEQKQAIKQSTIGFPSITVFELAKSRVVDFGEHNRWVVHTGETIPIDYRVKEAFIKKYN